MMLFQMFGLLFVAVASFFSASVESTSVESLSSGESAVQTECGPIVEYLKTNFGGFVEVIKARFPVDKMMEEVTVKGLETGECIHNWDGDFSGMVGHFKGCFQILLDGELMAKLMEFGDYDFFAEIKGKVEEIFHSTMTVAQLHKDGCTTAMVEAAMDKMGDMQSMFNDCNEFFNAVLLPFCKEQGDKMKNMIESA